MLRRWDWFSRSKFSFLWNKIYSIYLRITNSPSVIYRVEEEEGGTTNEKHHLIHIHWIYITEPPPFPPGVAAARIMYNQQYKHFHWRCLRYIFICSIET